MEKKFPREFKCVCENLSSIISYILVKRIGGILDWSQICYIVELDDVLDLCTVKNM